MKIKLELTGEQIDKIIADEMAFFIKEFESNMRRVNKSSKGVFFHSEKEKDLEDLQKHLDAFKVVLNFYQGNNL